MGKIEKIYENLKLIMKTCRKRFIFFNWLLMSNLEIITESRFTTVLS